MRHSSSFADVAVLTGRILRPDEHVFWQGPERLLTDYLSRWKHVVYFELTLMDSWPDIYRRIEAWPVDE